jgi:hypothetical protein
MARASEAARRNRPDRRARLRLSRQSQRDAPGSVRGGGMSLERPDCNNNHLFQPHSGLRLRVQVDDDVNKYSSAFQAIST